MFLREKDMIVSCKACLQRVHSLSVFRHGSPTAALSPENVNVRVFLAAYMIAFFPQRVFDNMGPLENALFEVAGPLIALFERICRIIHSSPERSFRAVPADVSREFPAMLFSYLTRFKAWKVPDEAKLTCRIRHALTALYDAERHLPPDEPEDSQLKVEFRTQIKRLRDKLSQIAGRAALEEFDAGREASSLDLDGPMVANFTTTAANLMPTGRMTNEQLAHELMLDPCFQLNDEGTCEQENPSFLRIRESFHRAFWESLVNDLRKFDDPDYVRVLRVLVEIRDGIVSVAGRHEASRAAEILDMDFIKSQVAAGAFTWDDCTRLVRSVTEIIRRAQSPKRDVETSQRWAVVERELTESDDHPRAFCSSLNFLLDRVNALRIDAANARLRLIAPTIHDHGVDYERGKFDDKLRAGALTLDRTKAWLRDALDSMTFGTKQVNFAAVHNAAVLRLVAKDKLVSEDDVPETLLMDIHRIRIRQGEFRNLASAAAMLVRVSHNPELAPLSDKVAELLAGDFGMSAKALSVSLELPELEALLETCSIHTDPVHMLL